MTTPTCSTCRWFQPGSTWPHYRSRGDCARITTAKAGERSARIYPNGADAWLDVSESFGCQLHEPPTKDKTDGR